MRLNGIAYPTFEFNPNISDAVNDSILSLESPKSTSPGKLFELMALFKAFFPFQVTFGLPQTGKRILPRASTFKFFSRTYKFKADSEY